MTEALNLVAFLVRISRGIPQARWKVLAALAAGLLSGMLYPLLIALLGTAVGRSPDRALFLAFLALCIAAPGTRLASQLLFDAIGTRAIFDLRLQLCRRVLATPLGRLEEIGPPRLLASLSDDLTAITSAFSLFPMLSMQVGVTVSSLAYMAWLSPRLFLLVSGVFALGIGGLRLPGVRTSRYFERARRETDAMFAHFRDLIYGSKELKLHRERRDAFLGAELVPTGEAMWRSTFFGSTAFNAASAWGNLLFFSLLGVLLFGPGRTGTDLRVLAGYLFALLYLKAPVEVLLQTLPALGRAAAAAAVLQTMEGELAAVAAGEPADEPAAGRRGSWRRLGLRDVTHTYLHQGGTDRFTLGPVSLALVPGEIVFLIGGNGSGKTTLAKILTGLYPPDTGQILLDGVPVDDETRDDYRQLFAAVFADFYLFDTLIGPEGVDPGEAAAAPLRRLQLDGKVTVKEGRLSTIDLSQGQRKRLALVAAALEDRPLYFFDEWAADQDPSYKQVFYLELLPELKARGKTVVVISHDDAYYTVADRLIKLTQGRIEWERRPA